MVRARASHARGHWFKSSNAHHFKPLIFQGFYVFGAGLNFHFSDNRIPEPLRPERLSNPRMCIRSTLPQRKSPWQAPFWGRGRPRNGWTYRQGDTPRGRETLRQSVPPRCLAPSPPECLSHHADYRGILFPHPSPPEITITPSAASRHPENPESRSNLPPRRRVGRKIHVDSLRFRPAFARMPFPEPR